MLPEEPVRMPITAAAQNPWRTKRASQPFRKTYLGFAPKKTSFEPEPLNYVFPNPHRH
jgi:hypothetical protein